MAAEQKIPQDLVQAFRNCTVLLRDWSVGGPEPRILLDDRKDYDIGAIGDFASQYDEPMPDDIYVRLCGIARFGRRPEDRTFAAGGRLLRRLYTEEQGRRAKVQEYGI